MIRGGLTFSVSASTSALRLCCVCSILLANLIWVTGHAQLLAGPLIASGSSFMVSIGFELAAPQEAERHRFLAYTSRLADRARPIRQCEAVAALSRLLPALPGDPRIRRPPASARCCDSEPTDGLYPQQVRQRLAAHCHRCHRSLTCTAPGSVWRTASPQAPDLSRHTISTHLGGLGAASPAASAVRPGHPPSRVRANGVEPRVDDAVVDEHDAVGAQDVGSFVVNVREKDRERCCSSFCGRHFRVSAGRIGQVRSPAVLFDEFAHFLSSSSERTDSVSSSQESVNFWMPSSSRTSKTSSRSTPASATAFMTCAASS